MRALWYRLPLVLKTQTLMCSRIPGGDHGWSPQHGLRHVAHTAVETMEEASGIPSKLMRLMRLRREDGVK